MNPPKSSIAATLLPSTPSEELANININVLDVDILQYAVRELDAIAKYNKLHVDPELLSQKCFLAQHRLRVALQKRKESAAAANVQQEKQQETLDAAITASLRTSPSVDDDTSTEDAVQPLTAGELRAARMRYYMSHAKSMKR
jgi:hypothetical protein